MHDDDRGGRQLDIRIHRLDRRVVPHLDLAEENIGNEGAGQLELAGLDAFNVDDGNGAADHGGKLHQAELIELLARHRIVGRAEIDRLGRNLLDAAARADRLVIHRIARGSLVI